MSSPSSAQASPAETCGRCCCDYVCICLQCQVLSLAALPGLMLSATCWLAIKVVALKMQPAVSLWEYSDDISGVDSSSYRCLVFSLALLFLPCYNAGAALRP